MPQGHDPHHICPAHEAPRPAAGFDAVPRQPVLGAGADPEAHRGRYEPHTGEGQAEPPTNLRIGGTGDGEQQPDTQRQCPPDEPQVRRLEPHPLALPEGAHGQPVIDTCCAQFLGVARRRSPSRADHTQSPTPMPAETSTRATTTPGQPPERRRATSCTAERSTVPPRAIAITPARAARRRRRVRRNWLLRGTRRL